MVGIGGPDEPVERDVQPLLQPLEHIGVAPSQIRGGHALGRGGLGHLEAVFVGAGEVPDVETIEPLEAGDRIGRDVLVRVPDVRSPVRVRDRGGHIEGPWGARPRAGKDSVISTSPYCVAVSRYPPGAAAT